MRKFISVGQKIFLTLIILLALAFTVLTFLIVGTTESNLSHFKQDKAAVFAQEFNLYVQEQNEQLKTLITELTHIENMTVDDLSNTLLRLFNQGAVTDYWLLDNATQNLVISPEFIHTGSPDEVTAMIEVPTSSSIILPSNPAAVNHIQCTLTCNVHTDFAITIDSKMFTLFIITPLHHAVDLLQKSHSLQAAIGTVDFSLEQRWQAESLPSVYSATDLLHQALLGQLNSKFAQDAIFDIGIVKEQEGQYYYLIMLPIVNALAAEIPATSPPVTGQKYLLITMDISEYYLNVLKFNHNIIYTALVLFILSTSIFYFLTIPYKRRLQDLAERIPLLNKIDYKTFKKNKREYEVAFVDEIDQLDEAANKLVDELHSMQEKIDLERIKLQQMALYDELTNLPNRNMLTEHLNHLIRKQKRHNTHFAVMLLDVDDFKKINDGHGHSIGDQLLQKVANRLQAMLRSEDIVCRFGGDEFVMVADDILDLDALRVFGEKVLSCFAEPIHIDNIQFHVSGSLGLTLCSSSSMTSEELLRQADTAMYRAKVVKGNSLQIYDAELNRIVVDKIELESEARLALENDNFYLALQPLIDIKNNHVIGFEALLRWRHPVKGLISPDEFIPVLEKSSFMIQLDYYVIERSMKVIKALDNMGYTEQFLAINLSASQFLDPKLCGFIKRMLVHYEVDPQRVEFELTETTLASDIKVATKIMKDIRELGVQLSIDDFGTGYSSLNYLRSMPVNKIKIDRTFIMGITENPADRQIVKSTIDMVHNMNMQIVAEGIEQVEQLATLRDMGCDIAQGFYISKPIPEHQLASMLDKIILNNIWIHEFKLSREIKFFN